MRNIDVIYNINEEAVAAGVSAARIDTLCEIENMDIFRLCQTEYMTLFHTIQRSFMKIAGLLKLLTDDYKARMEQTEIVVSEIISDGARVAAERGILGEEWEVIMEQIWSVRAFCEEELQTYRRMTQCCYTDSFQQINIFFEEEDGRCRDSSEIQSCRAMNV